MKKVNQIGLLKSKILSFMVESYTENNKNGLKNIIKLIRKNKDFSDLYVFYEETENKFIENENEAKQFIDDVLPLLEEKYKNVVSFLPTLNEQIGDIDYIKNPLYETMDILLSKKTIHNIDAKLKAKTNLIKHLTTKKDNVFSEGMNSTANESFLFATLANNFNALYDNTLDEEQKEEFKTILSMSSNDVEHEVTALREEILDKISSLLTENTQPDLVTKLETVKSEVGSLETSKRNLVKLQQLKNDLN